MRTDEELKKLIELTIPKNRNGNPPPTEEFLSMSLEDRKRFDVLSYKYSFDKYFSEYLETRDEDRWNKICDSMDIACLMFDDNLKKECLSYGQSQVDEQNLKLRIPLGKHLDIPHFLLSYLS